MAETSESRTRTWCLVVYPESLPENWRDIITEWQIEWVESPLHDQDINADGTVKKPHYHLLLVFGGVKSYDQVFELTRSLNCPIPQRCHSAKGAIRYMAHLDNPEKVQYKLSECKCHGGFDIGDFLKPTCTERHEILNAITDYVIKYDIVELYDLVTMCRSDTDCPSEWLDIIQDNTIYVRELLRSNRHRARS